MDINKLMKQMQQAQTNLTNLEKELNATEYTGGNEGVTIKMTGAHEVKEIEIAEDLMTPEDREMLQDLLLIAFNEAVDKSDADRAAKMKAATAGMKLPGM